MKRKISTLLIFVLLASVSVFAQNRNDLTGPAYKNYKPWENESKPTPVYSVSNKEQLTGPAYKNQKPWGKNTSEQTFTAVSFGSERSKLTGPAYKNYKPWRKNKD